MKDGKKLLSEIAALSPVPVFVRTHNLLTTGDGKADLKWGSTNAYTEDNYTEVLRRYGMLTITYTFRKFNGTPPPEEPAPGQFRRMREGGRHDH